MMERHNQKPRFALPHHFNRNQPSPLDSSTSSRQSSFFCKYASSVYETVPEDGLDSSKKPNNCIIQESEVNQYLIATSPRDSQVNPIPNMKKKPTHNILAYNFTNINILNVLLERIYMKKIRNAIDEMDNHRLAVNRRMKMEKQRKSSNIEVSEIPTFKNINAHKPPLDPSAKRKKAVDLIRGWVQFKALMATSSAFQTIKQYRKPMTSYSIPSCSNLPNQHYFEAKIEPSVSTPQRTEESLTYTVEPFDPQSSHDSKTNLSRLLKDDRSLFGVSIVSQHKDAFNKKESNIHTNKIPLKGASISHLKPRIASPIKLQIQIGRHLEKLTSCSELPLRASCFHSDIDRPYQDRSVMNDIFSRNQPESCDLFDVISGSLQGISSMFPSSQSSSKASDNSRSHKNSMLLSRESTSNLVFQSSGKTIPQASQLKNRFVQSSAYSRGGGSQQKKFGTFGLDLRTSEGFIGGERTKVLSKHDPAVVVPATLDLRQTKQTGIDPALRNQGPSIIQKNDFRYQESIVDGFVPQESQQPQSPRFAFPIKKEHQPSRQQRIRVVIPTLPKQSKSRNKSGDLRQMSPLPQQSGPLRTVIHPFASQRVSLKNSDTFMNSEKNIKNSSPQTHHYLSPQTHAIVKKIQSPHRVSFKPTQQQAYNIYQLNQGVSRKGQGRNIGHQYLEQAMHNNPYSKCTQQQITSLGRNSHEKGITVTSQKKDQSINRKNALSPQPYLMSPMTPQPRIHTHQNNQYMLRQHRSPPQNANIHNQHELRGSQQQFPTQPNPLPIPYLCMPSTERPKTSRPSAQRVNLFQRFWGADSQRESRPNQHLQPTNRNTSGMLRPKSMNDKILITLKK